MPAHSRAAILLLGALLFLAAGCESIKDLFGPGSPAKLVIVSGDAQSGTVAGILPKALTVRVTDKSGEPVGGVSVSWAVAAGGGSVTPLAAATNDSGLVLARWSLGKTAQRNAVTATSGRLSAASFTATAVPGPPALVVKVAGDEQRATVATTLQDSLVLKVTDAFENPVSEANVSWTATAGSGSISPATSSTRSGGLVKAAWTLGSRAGAQSVNVLVAELPTVIFTATASPGPPAQLGKLRGDGQRGVVGTAVADSLVSQVLDLHGNGIPGIRVTWSVTAGGGSIQPSESTTDSEGRARTQWVLGTPVGTQSVAASVAGLPPATFTASAFVLNLRIEAMYLTQSVQTRSGSVPLVKDRPGYLRVFATGSESNTLAPSVRIRFYSGGNLLETRIISAPGSSVPTTVGEEPLTRSWNVAVPGSLIQPNLGVLADVDPSNTVPETDETDNTFPASGTPLVLDVRAAATFPVRFVPVSIGGLTGDVSAANKSRFMEFAQKIYPLPGNDTDVRAVYSSSLPALQSNDGNGSWGRLISEVEALRVAEGTNRFYYGVVKVTYSSGIAGVGYIGGRTALGWEYLDTGGAAEIAAHEWGHNFNRRHAPCGNPGGVDNSYPYTGGIIGVFGLDVETQTLKPDTMKDVMSYCRPRWLSDYTYRNVLDYRAANPAPPAAAEDALLVWGRLGAAGLELEPAFRVTTRPVLPEEPGPYTLEGLDAGGRRLFSLSFQGWEVADAPDDARYFVLALPARLARPEALAALRLSGQGMRATARPTAPAAAPGLPDEAVLGLSVERTRPGIAELRWNQQAYPMVMVRDARTGEILSFARGGAASVVSAAQELKLEFSDGVRGFSRRATPRD